MADIPVWLRGFQRSRTPTRATSRAERGCGLPNTNNADVMFSGSHTASRTSSHPSFCCPSTPTTPKFDAHSQESHADEIWYNPEPDQMVETLKVFMMARGSFHPVPVKFNSCILHILETYQDMRNQLTRKDEEIQTIRQSYDNEIRNFEREVLRWEKEREDYRSDLGKLEVTLATKTQGLEPLTAARSGSVEDQENVGRERNYHNRYSSHKSNARTSQDFNGEHVTAGFLAEKVRHTIAYASRRQSLYDAVSGTTTARKQAPHPRTLKASPETLSWDEKSSPSRKASQSAPLGKRQLPRNCFSMSSSSSPANGLAPRMEDVTLGSSHTLYDVLVENSTNRQVLSSATDSRSLSKVPIGSPNKLLESSFWGVEKEPAHYGEGTPSNESLARHRFSFLPGDDYGILPTDPTKKYVTKNATQGYIDHNDQRRPGSGTSITTESCQLAQTKSSHRPKQKFKTERKLGPNELRTPGESTWLARENSQSSVITIIRDNSSRSNKAQDFCSKGVLEGPKLSRRNEARIAAVRALSGTERGAVSELVERARASG